MENEEIYVQMIMKSQSGEVDDDGNYIFEVEASNENLDLQNQIIQQKALLKSKSYFMTNGVISDDHQHRIRNENGEVETNLAKVIGEPLDVWTDGNKTFVKGKLYKNNKYAKGYIELLKANSSRVHASVGGIKPKVIKNADGTETVTRFIWNDLALTISPVNWTVGSAKFAKSLTNIEFCKALNAGSGADASNFKDGRAIQNEDLENKIKQVDTENQTIQKSDDDIIRECVIRIDTGELQSEKEIKDFLESNGKTKEEAQEILRELIQQGDEQMKKSNFFNTMSDFAKSLGKKECKKECKKSKTEEENDKKDDSEDEDFDFEENEEIDTDSEDDDEDDDEDDEDMKKSLEDDYDDGTEVIQKLSDEVLELRKMNKSLRDELRETQDSMIEVTKSLAEYLSTPNSRKTVVQKSMGANTNDSKMVSVKPGSEDFITFKNAIAKAIANKEIDPYKVTSLNSTFQKSMQGEQIAKSEWNEICAIVNKFGK